VESVVAPLSDLQKKIYLRAGDRLNPEHLLPPERAATSRRSP
jgi:hypothetical protein